MPLEMENFVSIQRVRHVVIMATYFKEDVAGDFMACAESRTETTGSNAPAILAL